MANRNEFEKAAAFHKSASLLADFLGMLRKNKKWWLAPVLTLLLVFGLLLLLSGTAAAPFIYSLF